MTQVTIEENVTTVTVTEANAQVTVDVLSQVTLVETQSGGSRDALFLRGTPIGDVPQPPPAGTILASNGTAWVPTVVAGLTVQVYGEEPVGDKDGVNTVFALNAPYVTGSLRIYLNGLRQRTSDVTEVSETEFELSEPPIAGDTLEVDYSAG